MTALRPAVDYLEKLKIPKIISILLLYIIIIGVMVIYGTIMVPPLVNQTAKFINHLPQLLAQVSLPFINLQNTSSDMWVNQIAPLSQNVAKITVGIFSNIFTLLTLAVFTFYFLLERDNLRKLLEMFASNDLTDQIVNVVKKVEDRMGAWIRGELLLMTIVGLMTFLGLTILGVNYALPLALIAGLLEIVPIVGPFITAIFGCLVGMTVSWGQALAVVILFIIIQQLENNLVVPQVMSRVTGLPPAASLLALMIGGRIAGMEGLFLAIPLLLVIQTISSEIFRKNN
jgi:predicted PurR-regulated permease PerM